MNNLSVYKELQKESLFNEWTDELMRLNSTYDNDNYAVEIWNIAKDYAYIIATAEYPLGMFKICQSEIQKKDPPFCFNAYKTCLGCIYTMIIKSADKAVVEQIIDYISMNDFFPINLAIKNTEIYSKIDNGELKDDYDYSKKKTRNKAAAKKINTADNGKTQALEKRIQELEEELAEYKKGPIVDKPHNKVVLEVFVKLLEKSGADLKKHGNKAIASRLAETITRLPLTTCQNYFSDRLKTTAHPDEVLKMNTAIKELGIEWQL